MPRSAAAVSDFTSSENDMWRASDAVINAADLADAVDEVERGKAPGILARLWRDLLPPTGRKG